MEINQDKESFRKWLRSQPETATAIAGHPCHCWLAEWFESQGVYVWGVYPKHCLDAFSNAPGGASQEILLSEPEEDEETGEMLPAPTDRIALQSWANEFACKLDRLYHQPFKQVWVTRNQALAVLSTLP